MIAAAVLSRGSSNNNLICPACAVSHIRRSHSRWYDPVLQRFSIYAFRCKACDHRFYSVVSPELKARILNH